MNREVHYDWTRRLALEAGFSEAEANTIAAADWNVDSLYDVRVFKNKGYHFAWLGANRRARRLLATAIDEADLQALGQALHCRQDAIGHGALGHVVHWDGIDRPEHRSPRVRKRLESATRTMLAEYREKRHLRGLSQVDATMV